MENLFERFGSMLKDYIDDEGFQNADRVQTAQVHRLQENINETHNAVPAQLLEDFKTLGFTGYADFLSCKKRYKNLLQKHHPDKYVSFAEEQKKVAVITIKIYDDFKNIEQWFKETA